MLAATRAIQIGDPPLAVYCLDLCAASIAARGDTRRAVVILGATEAAREAMQVEPDEDEEAIRAKAMAGLDRSSSFGEDAWVEGRALDLLQALELARGLD